MNSVYICSWQYYELKNFCHACSLTMTCSATINAHRPPILRMSLSETPTVKYGILQDFTCESFPTPIILLKTPESVILQFHHCILILMMLTFFCCYFNAFNFQIKFRKMQIIAIKTHEVLFPHFQKRKSEGEVNNMSLSNQPVTMNLN